jgi:MFS family permease
MDRMSSHVASLPDAVYFQPLFWSSFADWKGRRPLYLISIALYIGANILLATVPANYGALVFLRVVQAFGSSAVVSMGAGSVADVRAPIS